jgi:hypothetical protein
MTRTPLYVAAPYRANDPAIRDLNIRRAAALGQLAIVAGYAPIVPHGLSVLGIFGVDPLPPGGREVALAITRDHCILVAQSLGDLWVLARDDGSFSGGTAGEVDAFRAVDGGGAMVVRDWQGWREHFAHHGLAWLWEGVE